MWWRITILGILCAALGFTANIFTDVYCNGVHNNCYLGYNRFASASAGANWVRAEAWPLEFFDSFSAQARFQADYVLTVTGGVGMAFAEPCLLAGASWRGGAYADGSVGSVGVWASGWGNGGDVTCHGPVPDHGWLPFVFGVPQTLTVDFSTSVNAWRLTGATVGFVEFTGFRFFDAHQNLLTGITYTFNEVPEPGTFPILAAIAATALAIRARHRKDPGEVL